MSFVTRHLIYDLSTTADDGTTAYSYIEAESSEEDFMLSSLRFYDALRGMEHTVVLTAEQRKEVARRWKDMLNKSDTLKADGKWIDQILLDLPLKVVKMMANRSDKIDMQEYNACSAICFAATRHLLATPELYAFYSESFQHVNIVKVAAPYLLNFHSDYLINSDYWYVWLNETCHLTVRMAAYSEITTRELPVLLPLLHNRNDAVREWAERHSTCNEDATVEQYVGGLHAKTLIWLLSH